MAGLGDQPFAYAVTKDGRVRVSYGSRVVTTVGGTRGARLAAALAAADEDEVQQLLARATGNFKRGNERLGRPGRPSRAK
jgi:hypothetical protein